MAERLGIYDLSNQTDVDSSSDEVPVSDSFFAWGTVAPSSQGDLIFTVKNESITYTAYQVTLTTTDLGASVSLADQILFSMDNTLFTRTLNLSNIPPGAHSPPIIMRRVTKSNAVSGSYQIRLQAESWA